MLAGFAHLQHPPLAQRRRREVQMTELCDGVTQRVIESTGCFIATMNMRDRKRQQTCSERASHHFIAISEDHHDVRRARGQGPANGLDGSAA